MRMGSWGAVRGTKSANGKGDVNWGKLGPGREMGVRRAGIEERDGSFGKK